MKFSVNFLLGLTLIVAMSLATLRLVWIVGKLEFRCEIEKPFKNHFATGKPVQPMHSIEKEIREYEKILNGFGIPLDSTRFREDISLLNADPSLYFKDKRVQQLCLAITWDRLDEMQSLIKQKVDVNAQGDGGITPLLWAFAQKKPEAFQLLLKNGADPDLRLSDLIHMHGMYTNVGDNLFTISTRFLVSRQYLRDAIPYSKDIRQRSSNGDSLLMLFARPQFMGTQFDKASCEALIAAGVELNVQNDLGETVCTLSYSQPDKCLWFIEQGADPTLRRNDGKDVLDLIAPKLEAILKNKLNKPAWLATEISAARTDRLREESDCLKLQDTVLEFKLKHATESGSADQRRNSRYSNGVEGDDAEIQNEN